MIKYILFDFDGTLVNSNDIIKTLLIETAKVFESKDVEANDIISIFGKPLIEQMQHFSEENAEKMVSYYRDKYREREEETKIFDGIKELVYTLFEKGYKIAIVSNKGTRGITKGLKMFNLDVYIEYFVSSDMVENKKPHPEAIYKVKDFFDCEIEEMIMIGDTVHDIESGIRSGVKTVLVGWTLVPNIMFEKSRPDFTIGKPVDLIEILEECNSEEKIV
ncbi:HAD family hydrolase [Clostridium sp. DL1XJH146]